MVFGHFAENRTAVEEQYRNVQWLGKSGLSPQQLQERAESLTEELRLKGTDRSIIKARTFAMIMDNAQIAVNGFDLYQDHLRHGNLVQAQRREWIKETLSGPLAETENRRAHLAELGILTANYDFGHTVPDWYDILKLGFPGLLQRVQNVRLEKEQNGTLTEDQDVFFRSCEIVYEAVIRYVRRLAGACREQIEGNGADMAERLHYCADDLEALCIDAPKTLHQALQLAYLFHILQEEVEGERLRSLGGLDRVYRQFYENDLANGVLTREQAGELFAYFFQKFHALTGDHLFGEPLYIGGALKDGESAVNDLTWLILETYSGLQIANPKIHVRVSPWCPKKLVRCVCDYIRKGNSSFVFISDACALPMMRKVGCTEAESYEYVPIGCYEPGILGREVACTGNGGYVMPKAMELALHDGVDPVSGEKIGPATGKVESFETFAELKDAVLKQMLFLTDESARIICDFEKYYMQMNPSPLFSATMVECVETGMDAYAGGAKYNNSSLYMYGTATLADSLTMIDTLVYRRREMSLTEFIRILDSNWEGEEKLRMRILRDGDKWGNDMPHPDEICVELTMQAARYANSLKNARGGRFKAAMYTIDKNYEYGKHLGATADGRRAGEPVSRNLGATSTMDRKGVTALIASCTKLDMSEFPTGSVLDFMLHPSAVAGDEGLTAFTGLIETYICLGGYAIHGNVFDAAVLRAAQARPAEYCNLQVRVCGWNVYFVNLSREEQDEFIRRAEAAS